MKKNYLWVMLLAVLTMGFVACSDDDDNGNKGNKSKDKAKITGIWMETTDSEDPVESTVIFDFKANGKLGRKVINFTNDAYDGISEDEGTWDLEEDGVLLMTFGSKTFKVNYTIDEETDIMLLTDGKNVTYVMKGSKELFDIILKYIPLIGAWENENAPEYLFYFNNNTCYQIDLDSNGNLNNIMQGEWDLEIDEDVIHEEWSNGLIVYDFKCEATETTLKQEEVNKGNKYSYKRADPVKVKELIDKYSKK